MNTFARPLLPLMWLAAIVAAETLGRRSPSDGWDALGVCVFSGLVAASIAAVARSRDARGRRIRRLARSIGRRATSWWPDMGLDLRGEPPVPRGFPGSLLACTILVGSVAAAAWAARAVFPARARAVALGISPTAYLLVLSAGWACLLLAIGAAAFSCWRDLDDHLRHGATPPARPRAIGLAAGLAWVGLVAALVFLAPLAVAWVACGAVAATGWAVGTAIDRHEPLRVIWRSAGHAAGVDRRVRVFHAGAAIRWDHTTMALLLPAITIPATGIGWSGSMADTMPVTIGLGAAAMWGGVLALASYVLHGAARLLALARLDPAAREPVPLLVDRDPGALAATPLRRHGFQWLGPDDPRRRHAGARRSVGPAVSVSIDPGLPRGAPAPFRFPSPAPGGASAAVGLGTQSLTELETLAQLRRLDTALLREHLVRGLMGLLERAATRRFGSGSGFWLVPHLWFARGLTRDSDDPDYYSIGPPYHRVIPRRARQHLHAVLRALDIDLIFAEDGTGVEGIRGAFARMFDLYDVLGPGRVEEAQFVGVPQVRVFLHDFTLGEPLRRRGYPEPEYDEIGRARILHIMVDRGGGDGEPDPLAETPHRRPTTVNL